MYNGDNNDDDFESNLNLLAEVACYFGGHNVSAAGAAKQQHHGSNDDDDDRVEEKQNADAGDEVQQQQQVMKHDDFDDNSESHLPSPSSITAAATQSVFDDEEDAASKPQVHNDNCSSSGGNLVVPPQYVTSAIPVFPISVMMMLMMAPPSQSSSSSSSPSPSPSITAAEAETETPTPTEVHHRCKWPKCLRAEQHFSSPYELQRHLEDFHTLCAPYQCEWPRCNGKAYKARSLLMSHVRKHSNHLPFVCSNTGCGKAFRQPTNLLTHQAFCIANHHTICPLSSSSAMTEHRSPLFTFECVQCGALITQWRLAVNHVRALHGDDNEDGGESEGGGNSNKRRKFTKEELKLRIKRHSNATREMLRAMVVNGRRTSSVASSSSTSTPTSSSSPHQ